SVMPCSMARSTTFREDSISRIPKLLQPRPTTETSMEDFPSLRFFIAQILYPCRLYRPRKQKGRRFPGALIERDRRFLEVRTHPEAVSPRIAIEGVGIEARGRAGQIHAGFVGVVEDVLDEALHVPVFVGRVEREQRIGHVPRRDSIGRVVEDAAPHLVLPIVVDAGSQAVATVER